METLPLFARFLARTMGLHFNSDRLPELQKKMSSLAREAGYPDLEKYLLWLMSGPLSREQQDLLAGSLTIGETYFLRDPNSYQVLEEHLLPELIASRRGTDRTLRIWSAGCSTGEEPYSIAILLTRVIPDLASWNITLIASDINPLALERGRLGIYSKWSFRNAPTWLMSYFTKREDGRFEIVEPIRKMVRFTQINLADEKYAAPSEGISEIDIIFCRNVMLYFDAPQIEKTMARFHEALKDSGWLFVGPTEVDHHSYPGFSCRHYGGAFVLCKQSPRQQAHSSSSRLTPPHGPDPAQIRKGTAAFAVAPPEGSAGSPRVPTAACAVAEPRLPAAKPSAAPASPVTSGPPEKMETGGVRTTRPDGYAEALALYQAGHYQQAADRALGSPGSGRDRANALELGARAYANIGRFPEARDCCEKAIACERLNPHSHYLLSIILEQQGDTRGAVTSLKHALFIDHDYLLAYFALGNLTRQCGDMRESERNFANALRLLERRDPHEVLPEAEGMTAGRLAELIRAMNGGARG
jgi:chemotaxis protein methyltransferase CheR